jgi:uncharacterized Zn-binding protein involved in type VI secretion
MPGAVRIGDPNSAGGIATGAGAPSVKINGRSACTPGTKVTPHPCCPRRGCAKHCAASTVKGSTKVFVEGKPLVFVGSSDSCGHSRSLGSTNVNVGI